MSLVASCLYGMSGMASGSQAVLVPLTVPAESVTFGRVHKYYRCCDGEELVLGRKTRYPLPSSADSVGDVRCSRAQLLVQYTGGKFLVTRKARNPSFFKKKDEEELRELAMGEPEQLHAGDTLFLFLSQFPLRLAIVEHASTQATPTSLSDDSLIESLPSSLLVDDLSMRNDVDDSQAESRLAFPSISTGVFGFDIEKAAEILCDVAKSFLSATQKDLTLILVDVTHSEMQAAVRKRISTLADPKLSSSFQTIVCDITKLKTAEDLPCAFIGNSANSRFSAKSSGVNRAIFQAAGAQELHERTKSLCPGRASVGVAYPVILHDTSPLRDEGVHTVIHVLGPNMNPNRPMCLNGDYIAGSDQLRQCYLSLFQTFANLTGDEFLATPAASSSQSDVSTSVSDCGSQPEPRRKKQPINAFDLLMSKGPLASQPTERKEQQSLVGKPGWSSGLLAYLQQPEDQDAVFFYDKDLVVIHDKYPKARVHLLIMPRFVLPNFAALRTDHLPMLRLMRDRALAIIEGFRGAKKDLTFRYGFHALPSMKQVHLHVISQDFNSPCLKTKKHWNSFTTSFFVPLEDLTGQLNERGRVEFDNVTYGRLLKGPLLCHRCGRELRNMPKVKQHIASCTDNEKSPVRS